jgi:hypothetical protein
MNTDNRAKNLVGFDTVHIFFFFWSQIYEMIHEHNVCLIILILRSISGQSDDS